MSDLVTELHIVGDDNNIFDTDMEYIIYSVFRECSI